MKEKDFLYRLLYYVLIEIREEAYTTKNKKIFWLSDLLHNLPLVLSKTTKESDYAAAWAELEEKAKDQGLQQWLEQRKLEFNDAFPSKDGTQNEKIQKSA